MMSSGTCNVRYDTNKAACSRPSGHPGDHFEPPAPVELCGAKQSKHSQDSCKSEKGHEGRHSDPAQGVSWPQDKAPADPKEPCGMLDPSGELDCSYPSGHSGTGHQVRDAEGVLHTWYGVPKAEPLHSEPALLVPDSVRTRVRLHAAQTEYDLTVLRNRLDCMPTVTNVSKELRRKREQLTAELEAWQYLSKITHTRMDW